MVEVNERSLNNEYKKIVERDTILQIISVIDEGIGIVSAIESPDFELSYNNKSIGAELVRLVEIDKISAHIDKITKAVEKMLAEEFPNHKYLINYTLNKNVKSEDIDQNDIFEILSTAIKSTKFGRYGNMDIPNNNYIQEVSYMIASTLSLYRNEGVCCLSGVSSKQVNKVVSKKNAKLKDYESSFDEQWLFVTIPIGGKYGNLDLADDLSDIIDNLVVNGFDRIYLSCFTRVVRIK